MSLITGRKLPQSIIENVNWIQPENIILNNGKTTYTNEDYSRLIVGNFQLNIPDGYDVSNIEIRVKGYREHVNATLKTILIDDTSTVRLSYPVPTDYNQFSTDNEYHIVYSGKLNRTWSADEINNIKLALEATAELHIDHVDIQCTYTEKVKLGQATNTGFGETGDPVCQSVVNAPIQLHPVTLLRTLRASDTFAVVKDFKLPDGNDVDMSKIGGYIPAVINARTSNEENVRITNVVYNFDGRGNVKLDFGSLSNRGIGFIHPYNAEANRTRTHVAGAELIVTEPAFQMAKGLTSDDLGCKISAPIIVKDEGVTKTSYLRSLNFKGASIKVEPSATQSFSKGKELDVTILSNGETAPAVITAVSTATTGTAKGAFIEWVHDSSGIDRLLIVDISTESATSITSVTYDGVPLTKQLGDTQGSVKGERWFLLNPTTGTKAIRVEVTPNSFISAGARTFAGANQASPFDGTNIAKGTVVNANGSVTTTNNNSLILDSVMTGFQPITHTTSSGQTKDYGITTGATRQITGGSQVTGMPNTFTTNYTLSSATDWVVLSSAVAGIKLPSQDEKVKTSSADSTAEYLQDKIKAGTNITINKVTTGGVESLEVHAQNGGTAVDEKVKVSSTDTTTGFLEDKIIAGSGIALNKVITGGSEKIEVVNTAQGGGNYSIGSAGDIPLDIGQPIKHCLYINNGIQIPGVSLGYTRDTLGDYFVNSLNIPSQTSRNNNGDIFRISNATIGNNQSTFEIQKLNDSTFSVIYTKTITISHGFISAFSFAYEQRPIVKNQDEIFLPLQSGEIFHIDMSPSTPTVIKTIQTFNIAGIGNIMGGVHINNTLYVYSRTFNPISGGNLFSAPIWSIFKLGIPTSTGVPTSVIEKRLPSFSNTLISRADGVVSIDTDNSALYVTYTDEEISTGASNSQFPVYRLKQRKYSIF